MFLETQNMSRKSNKVPEMDIFSTPNIESAITGETETEYFPLNPVLEGYPIQFDIPETYTQFTDPHFLIKVRVKILKSDGKELDDNAKVGSVNLLLHALFKDVILKANGVIINQANGTYPFRAYIETVYSYSSLATENAVGAPQLFYKDTPGRFNGVAAGVNNGFDKRVVKFTKSKEVEMAGRLHCDLLLQNKLIVPGVKFSLTLIPSPSEFTVMSEVVDGKEKLIITAASIRIRRINLTSSNILSIEKSLQSMPAKYQVTHAVVRTSQIPAATTQISNLVLHNGQIPRFILITTVSSLAFSGVRSHSPFNFSWEKCIQAQVAVDGKLFPNIAYQPHTSPVEPYLNLLRVARKLYTDSNISVTFDDFVTDGYQVLPFDLAVDEGGIPPKSNGTVTFSAQWSPTSFQVGNYTLIYYMIWDNTISIDARKNIILDYIP